MLYVHVLRIVVQMYCILGIQTHSTESRYR